MTPEHVGPYTPLHYLGHGGMAIVYLAEHRRTGARVALKLAQRGHAHDVLVRRFEHERRTLERLEHPNIVRLLDGGTCPGGLPYLVLEHVAGKPIDRYCSVHRLDVAARLELFAKVCGGVEHAHRRGVIHRDLKPDHILVPEAGEPRIIDFGVAARRGDTVQGATPELVTLRYASPEQLQSEPAAPASDVYSLGVILCELLTGRLPYRLDTGWSEEVKKAIRDREPELDVCLATGLAEILSKALCKDPAKRFRGAARLAAAVVRYNFRQRIGWNYPEGREGMLLAAI